MKKIITLFIFTLLAGMGGVKAEDIAISDGWGYSSKGVSIQFNSDKWGMFFLYTQAESVSPVTYKGIRIEYSTTSNDMNLWVSDKKTTDEHKQSVDIKSEETSCTLTFDGFTSDNPIKAIAIQNETTNAPSILISAMYLIASNDSEMQVYAYSTTNPNEYYSYNITSFSMSGDTEINGWSQLCKISNTITYPAYDVLTITFAEAVPAGFTFMGESVPEGDTSFSVKMTDTYSEKGLYNYTGNANTVNVSSIERESVTVSSSTVIDETGKTGIDYEHALEEDESHFSDIGVGDIIVVALANAADDGDSPVLRDCVNWSNFSGFELNTEHTILSLMVTEENIGLIRQRGINITGNGPFDVTSVTLYTMSNKSNPSTAILYGVCYGNKDGYSDGEYSSVTIKRSLINGINTICLPFDADAEQIGGEGAIAYTLAAGTSSSLTFSKVSGTLSANTPYLLVTTSASSEIVVSNVTLSDESAGEVTVDGYSMVGNYEIGDKSAQSKWGINGSGNLQIGGSGAKLSAFSAYFTGDFSAETGVKAYFIDDETGINTVHSIPVQDGNYYNLAGQRIEKPSRGIYVVNGKKLLVK